MRTAVGAPDPHDWSSQQPHILFNDRRTGEGSKNRAVGESHVVPKSIARKKPPAPHTPDKWSIKGK